MTDEEKVRAEAAYAQVRESVAVAFGGEQGFDQFIRSLSPPAGAMAMEQLCTIATKLALGSVPSKCALIAASFLGEMLAEVQKELRSLNDEGPPVSRQECADIARRTALSRAARMAASSEYFTAQAIFHAVLARDAISYLVRSEEIASQLEEVRTDGPPLAVAAQDAAAKDFSYLFGETRVGKC